MKINDEIPPITRPGYQNPTPVSAVFPDHNFIDDADTHVIQGHYWRRVKATNVPCGNSASVEINEKTGVSRALLVEVANALEVAVVPLKNTLSMKMSVTDTFTDERTVSFKMNIGPKECIAITFAEWQRIVQSVLRRQKYFLWFKTRIAKRTLDIATEEFQSDQFEYLDPNCCPEKIEEAAAKGFTKILCFNFGRVSFAIQARKKDNGKVSLFGIPGEFTPGQAVAIEDVGAYLRSYGHNPEGEITLSKSLGTVDEFYGWTRKERGRPNSLPWLLVLGTSSLLAYLLRPTSRGASKPDVTGAASDETKSKVAAALEKVDSYVSNAKPELRPAKAHEEKRELTNYD